MRDRDKSIRVTSCAVSLCALGLLWGCGDGDKKATPDARPLDTRPDLPAALEAGPEATRPDLPGAEAGPETTKPVEPPAADANHANPNDLPTDNRLITDSGAADAGPPQLDGGDIDGGGVDSAMDIRTWSPDVTHEYDMVIKRDAYVIPTDEQSCVQATGLPTCGLAIAVADIVPWTAGQLLNKAEVTSGTCTVSSCRGGCDRLTVMAGQPMTPGSTCDLLVTLWDGGQRQVQVTLVSNPSPRYACCGYPLPPNAGQWVPINPVLFQPNPIFVTSPIDGGNWDAPRMFDAPAVDKAPPSER